MAEAYGFDEHVHRYGNGDNKLRTKRLAQPRALTIGDILATGDKVLSQPEEGSDGLVILHLYNSVFGKCRIMVPSRVPIALLTEEDNAPESMRKGL